MTRVALLVSRIRVEEKLLLGALEAAGADVQLVDDDQLVLGATLDDAAPHLLSGETLRADVVLERSISTARGTGFTRYCAPERAASSRSVGSSYPVSTTTGRPGWCSRA